jgi:colicin import membrane protein
VSETAAPAPTNGSTAVTTQPAAPAPTKDVATGPQTTEGPVRGPDGKFVPRDGQPAVDEDPEIDFGDMKLRRSQAKAELARARHASRLLTEAEKRARAADDAEKRHAERRAKAKEDISVLFEDLGLTPEQERALLSKHLYSKHIEPTQLTEEQRELRAAQAKLSQYEAEKQAAAEKARKEEAARLHNEEAAALEQEILEAAKAGRIPSARAAVRRIAAKLEQFESRGLSLPLEQVAAVVREEVGRETGEWVQAASIEERRELWGEPTFKAEEKKWRDYFLAKLKTPPMSASRPAPQEETGAERQKLTPQEFKRKFF